MILHAVSTLYHSQIMDADLSLDRTKELRKLGFAGRHLGPIQMSTDTAVNVARRVAVDKGKRDIDDHGKMTQQLIESLVPLDQIPYIDSPEIYFSKHESVNMPYRYIAITKTITTKDGQEKTIKKPLMPPGMLELIKKDSERTLDFQITYSSLFIHVFITMSNNILCIQNYVAIM